MTTYMDPAIRRHLAERANLRTHGSMIPGMYPKADLEFPPGCGRDALNAALALTSIG